MGRHQDRVRRLLAHCGEGGIEIIGRVHAERHNLHAQPLRLDLCRPIAQGHAQIVGVPQHR
ncbi:MAG TPA: hypothetical protein VJ349_01455, partial [Stellaceae bacterium]|nr:hypothetical protein [Stellaceae bacterium]